MLTNQIVIEALMSLGFQADEDADGDVVFQLEGLFGEGHIWDAFVRVQGENTCDVFFPSGLPQIPAEATRTAIDRTPFNRFVHVAGQPHDDQAVLFLAPITVFTAADLSKHLESTISHIMETVLDFAQALTGPLADLQQ